MNFSFSNKFLLETINHIEDTLNHKLLEINTVNIWPLLRISICFDLIAERYSNSNGTKIPHKRLNLFNAYKNYRSYRSMAVQNFNFEKLDVTHDVYLINIDGVVYDRVHYRNELHSNKDELSLTNRINLSDYTLRDINNNNIQEFKDIIQLIKIFSIPFSIFIFLKNFKIFLYTYSIYKLLRRKNINVGKVFLKLPFRISYMFFLSFCLKNLFKNSNIKNLCHANYYSLESMAFTMAAKQIGISVINFQHGVQAENHPAFGKWNNIPLKGYDLLPSKFMCWDQSSVDILNKYFNSCDSHSVELSSYKWVDAWKNNNIAYSNASTIKALADRKYNILVTLQPSISGIQDIILNNIKASKDNVKWWIRIHPRQLNTNEANLIMKTINDLNLQKSINIREATNNPLPLLFSVADLHVTGFSSCIYEASYFNVNTVLTHKMGQEYYGDNMIELKAFFCESSKSLKEVIENGVKNKF